MLADLVLSEQVFENLKEQTELYREFLHRYDGLSANDTMKHAMTDMAFAITGRVWTDLPTDTRGKCFFCIGGINAINPVSATAVTNEIAVYVEELKDQDYFRIPPDEGAFYDMDGTARACRLRRDPHGLQRIDGLLQRTVERAADRPRRSSQGAETTPAECSMEIAI